MSARRVARRTIVTQDSIDEVTDDDFATAFVPQGKFKLDEEAQRRCMEGQRREEERLRRRAREDRIRRCERIWETSVRCIRDEKARVVRKKEEQGRIRRRAESEATHTIRKARPTGRCASLQR